LGRVEAAAEEAVEGALADEGLQVGDPDPEQRAHCAVGQHAAKPHRHERWVSDRLGQTNQVDATAYRWLSIMRGGHSCVTQFRNQEDTGGHERTRRARRLSTGGHARNRRDTEGHAVVPVRDREAPGSNPGPPTKI
jgi:hypothetical protein